ncbi:MAG: beta-ketoacyl synthase N-terminal-like domain-containing protein, partial [Bdellovibrionota bacterium]
MSPKTSPDIYVRPPRKPDRRVVVTGIGMLTPIGLNTEESWKNALAGVSGIDRITQFDPTGFDVQFAGEVKGFDANLYIEKKEQKKMDRFIHFAMACAEMAMKDSGLTMTEELGDRAGCLVGVGIGGLGAIENTHKTLM